MKFLLLFTLIVVCTASTLYRGKNVIVNEDSIEILGRDGRKICINRPTGERNIEIEIKGPRMITKRILIDERNHVHTETADRGMDEEVRRPREIEARSQGETLTEIFKQYQGDLDQQRYEELLDRINEAVRRGDVNPEVYRQLERFQENQLSSEIGQEQEGEEGREQRDDLVQQREAMFEELRQQLNDICNQLQRLQQLQQQRPTTNIIELIQRQQQLGNLINLLQQQIDIRLWQLRQCLEICVQSKLRAEQQKIMEVIDLLQQQQQIQFEQTQIIPGLTPWQQQQQIANTINGLQQVLQQQQQCQQILQQEQLGQFSQRGSTRQQGLEQQQQQQQQPLRRRFGGWTPWEQQQPLRQELLGRGRRFGGGLTLWEQQQQQQQQQRQQQIEALLRQQQQQRALPQNIQLLRQQQQPQQLQQQEPIVIGMTEQVQPFQGILDTDGRTRIVGARVGNQVVYHTLPITRTRTLPGQSNRMDYMMGQPQLRLGEILGNQPVRQFVY